MEVQTKDHERSPVVLAVAWALVGLPLLWGVAETLRKAWALFS